MVVYPAGSHWDENGKIAMSGESQDIDLVWTKNNIHLIHIEQKNYHMWKICRDEQFKKM